MKKPDIYERIDLWSQGHVPGVLHLLLMIALAILVLAVCGILGCLTVLAAVLLPPTIFLKVNSAIWGNS
jgi:hypothetical protein